MSKGTILVTDSLFIDKENEEQITRNGYSIDRLDTPTATESELIERVKGKVGYVLGGIEHVTKNVIDAADSLRAIAFTGADWRHYIPGHETATAKNIAIASTPGANSTTVAEFTTAIMLAMTRNIFELGRTGTKRFSTSKASNELTVGIVGMGRIGTQMTHILRALGAKRVVYYSRRRVPEIENATGVEYMDLHSLLSNSDVVTLHASQEAGTGYIGKAQLQLLHPGSIILNCGFTGAFDADALFDELSSGRLRAFQDDRIDDRFDALPLYNWFNSNLHTAYNTYNANKTASDMATASLLNLLATGKDQYRVN